MNGTQTLYGFVMARLREKRIPQRKIAAGSGVPFSTVAKIAQGRIKAPNVHHIQALYDYFVKIDCENGPSAAQAEMTEEAA